MNTSVEITNLNNDHNSANNSLNDQFNANSDYEIKGANGRSIVNMNGGENARDVARSFNLVTGSTGVSASVVTRAKIVSVSSGDHFTFTLQGKDKNASIVNATVSDQNNLTTLKLFYY